MTSFGKGSIGRRLAIATVIFFACITLLNTSYQLYIDYRRNLKTIHDYFKVIENSYVRSLSESVWMYDGGQIAAQLDGLIKLPDMEYLEIEAGDEYKWFSGSLRSKHTITQSFPLEFRRGDQVYDIGSLKAIASLDNIYDRLISKSINILTRNAIQAILLSGFVLFIFHLFVNRYLVELSERVKAIDLNRNPERIDLKRKRKRTDPDEIDRVVHALNETQEKLYQSYEALRHSEDELFRIFTMSIDLISIADINTATFIKVNPAFSETLGFTEEELTSKPFIAFIHPDDVESSQRIVEKELKAGNKVINFENRYLCKNGTYRWLRWVSHPKPEMGLSYAVAHDITDLKQMEEELHQKRKMESIGTLTGGIAHDFNNILGIIIGNTELALDALPEGNPIHSCLKEIETASLRATHIVKQLLSFSRKTEQKLQPTQIAVVIKDALKFLRSTIPTTIDIVQDIRVTDEAIFADPTQINQIMMNLCINASQAMEQTGGNITVGVKKVILDPYSAKDYPGLENGMYANITIKDTGPGIDPRIIHRIFDPYFTTKEIGKGSGMGLAVVHGIVKNHNGAIFVNSKIGVGTTFSIFFPITTEKAKLHNKAAENLLMGSERVLLVDDERSLLLTFRKMLERMGYQVETSLSAQDALEKFSANPKNFELVITDMTMPKMSGVMLSAKIKETRPDIPVIICSGYSDLIDEESAKYLGIAAYIVKPINITEISKIIRKVLDEAKF